MENEMEERQDASLTPSEVFRDNLHQFAGAQGLEFDGLASALGFIRADKKWLRRAWTDGLARSDKRAIPRLEKIAARFGLSGIDELWNPSAAKDQATVLRSVQMDDAAWEQLVGKVIEYVDTVQTFRATDPHRAYSIEANYHHDMAEMIASWIRPLFGVERSEEDEVAAAVLAATRSFREFREQTSLHVRVWKIARSYEEWSTMEEELQQELGQEDMIEEIKRRLIESISRQPTEQELAQRFYESYLTQYSELEEEEEVTDKQLTAFLKEMSHHKEYMDSFVNEAAAHKALAKKWHEIEEKSLGAISVKDAVKYIIKDFHGEFDDEDFPEEDVMPGELGNC